MAHRGDVGVAGDDADGIRDRFALGGGRGIRAGKAEHRAAQIQHRGLKGEAGTGAGLVEQGGELFVGADVLIRGGIGGDAVCQREQIAGFLDREVERIE